MNKHYTLPGDVTTREVLRRIRDGHVRAESLLPPRVEWTEERRRGYGYNVYVFGLVVLDNDGVAARSTTTVSYFPDTRTLRVVIPDGFTRWSDSDMYDRARIKIADYVRDPLPLLLAVPR